MADLTGAIQLRKTSDETVNNSDTLQDDDDFLFSVAANEVWTVEIHASTSILVASDFKCTFTLPAGASMFMAAKASGGGSYANGVSSTPGTAIPLLSSASTFTQVHVYAVLIMSSTAGTAQFQWAQNSAVAEDTKVLTNSFLIAAKEA